MAEPEIDRSKLKSFQDITNLQNRCAYSSRRNKPPRTPQLLIRRLPDRQHRDNPFEISDEQAHPRGWEPPPVFKTYACVRKKTTNIRGSRQIFQFFDGDELIYSAKFKEGKVEYIPIVRDKDPHLASRDCEAALLYGNHMCDFSLRKDDRFGDELLSIQIRRYDNEPAKPRVLECFFSRQGPGCPDKLKSAEPTISSEGVWEIDLNSYDSITSIKNCRLDGENGPHCFIRKMEKSKLELEARTVIDELRLFAIGIGSFLCKK